MTLNHKKVQILTDFDGTLTDKGGWEVVFTPFYQSLQVDPHADYKSKLLPQDILATKLKAAFDEFESKAHYRDPRRISANAVNFLKEVLAHERIGVAIITRNQTDYITAMFTYEGFTPEQINKISIFDNLSKDKAAEKYLTGKLSPQAIYVFDDDPADANAMKTGSAPYSTKVVVTSVAPGKFDWPGYLGDIKRDLNNKSISALFPARCVKDPAAKMAEEAETTSECIQSP